MKYPNLLHTVFIEHKKNVIKFPFTCTYSTVINTDKVKAVGYDLADPAVLPALELRNITVQAFSNGKISESKTTCT